MTKLIFYPIFETMEKVYPINDLIRSIVQNLESIYPLSEAQQVAFLLLEHFMGISKKDQMLNTEIILSTQQDSDIKEATDRLLAHEPVQYVIGKAAFYGRDFKVGPEVLIPRPETEELVHWVIQQVHSSSARVLDIGTGSGCIPITLDLELGNAEIYSLDNSEAALSLAQVNAQDFGANITFYHLDILKELPAVPPLDVLISNPPYVPSSDRTTIKQRVKFHEPPSALFVPDDDPLLFYKRLATIAPQILHPGGSLFMEIYHAYGPEIEYLFQGAPWSQVHLKKDINGKDRMIKATLVRVI